MSLLQVTTVLLTSILCFLVTILLIGAFLLFDYDFIVARMKNLVTHHRLLLVGAHHLDKCMTFIFSHVTYITNLSWLYTLNRIQQRFHLLKINPQTLTLKILPKKYPLTNMI